MSCFDYELSELLPIVSELTEKYTSKESSSVTYECAQHLMEAVQYTIYENLDLDWLCRGFDGEKHDRLMNKEEAMDARKAYQRGGKILKEKVQYVKERYNQLTFLFNDYGNENLKSTVLDGFPGFLKYYDVRFSPQDEILTRDYPILSEEKLNGMHGIDVILGYLDEIWLEQSFLHLFPKELVEQVLRQYHSEYKDMLFNLCQPMLNHVLGCLIAGKSLEKIEWSDLECERIEDYVLMRSREQREQELTALLECFLMKMKKEEAEGMRRYLMYAMESFLYDLSHMVEGGCIRRLFSQDQIIS